MRLEFYYFSIVTHSTAVSERLRTIEMLYSITEAIFSSRSHFYETYTVSAQYSQPTNQWSDVLSRFETEPLMTQEELHNYVMNFLICLNFISVVRRDDVVGTLKAVVSSKLCLKVPPELKDYVIA